MSPNYSDELDPTLPGNARSGGSGAKPVPNEPSEAADEGQDATLHRDSGRTVVRGGAGGAAAPKAGGESVDLTRPSSLRTTPTAGLTGSGTSAGTTAGASGGGEGGAGAAKREPQIFGGRFEVVEVLGEGGMGKVYSVRDRQIEGRAVALKVLLPKFSRNEKFRTLFFQEIRAAQNFVNEHVVQVRDCGQMDDGRLFVTMDLVSGESLRDMLAREDALLPRHALEVARQLLLALHSGHERGFVHRDVKPSNVMLTTRVPKTDANPYGVGVRVLDFGIAGLVAELDEGNVAGTPLYMSPEQIQGQRLDARSDLFAVGIVLYEMLSGRRPFEGKTLQQITHSVIETDVAPRIAEMKDVSAPVRRILEKALQKDRDKRFQSATDFAKAIETSSAYKLPSAVPGWVVGALVVVTGVAGAEGWMLRSQASRLETLEDERIAMQKSVDEAQNEAAARLNETQSARTAELNAKINDLAERDRQLNDANAALIAAQEQVAKLQTDLAKAGAKDSDQMVELRTQLDSLRRDFEQERTAREAAARDKQLVDEELLRMRKKQDELVTAVDEARRERDALTVQLNPSARKANTFDDVLSILERRGGDQARSLYDQAVDERIFERPARAGTDLVEELIAAETASARFDASLAEGGTRDIAALLEASRRFTQARALRENFQLAANAWLMYDSPTQTGAQRVQRLESLMRTLSERIDPHVAEIASYRDQEWQRLLAAGPAQGPAAALGYAQLFGGERFAEFMRLVATHCETQLAPGGKLDRKQLAEARFLDEWGAHLESDKSLNDDAAGALLAFWYARRWYDNDERNDAGFDWSRVKLPAVTGVQRDWRAVLRTQWDISQAQSGYPIRSGRKLVYRVQNESPQRWKVLEVARGVELGPQGPWEYTQNQFKADALPIGAPETVRVVRRNGVYTVDGASDPLLDLKASGDNVWIAPFPKLFDQLPPPQIGVSQVALQEHRERIAESVSPCLVFKRGAVLRWFSPEFGMVLEELEGSSVRTELVFATPLR